MIQPASSCLPMKLVSHLTLLSPNSPQGNKEDQEGKRLLFHDVSLPPTLCYLPHFLQALKLVACARQFVNTNAIKDA